MTTPRTHAEELAEGLTEFIDHPDAYPWSSANITKNEWKVLRAAADILAEAVKR